MGPKSKNCSHVVKLVEVWVKLVVYIVNSVYDSDEIGRTYS